MTPHLRQFACVWRLDGVTAETIAVTVALGVVIGVFPMYGVPTLLCAAAMLVFRPYLPLLHTINIVTSPLQLASLVPFHRAGARLIPDMAGAAQSGPVWLLAGLTARAIAGWFLICVPLGFCLYFTVLHVAGRIARVTLTPSA